MEKLRSINECQVGENPAENERAEENVLDEVAGFDYIKPYRVSNPETKTMQTSS